jgi:hypothetical protein
VSSSWWCTQTEGVVEMFLIKSPQPGVGPQLVTVEDVGPDRELPYIIKCRNALCGKVGMTLTVLLQKIDPSR